ncbi:MAG: hypothetical protein V1694_06250 [Candidatus Eisenbacteria bacterium]
MNILGTFTHYWFCFVLLSQAVAHLILFSKAGARRFWTLILLSIIPFAIIWGPVLVSQMGNGATSWMVRPGAAALADTLLAFYGGGLRAPLLSVAVYAAFVLLVIVRLDRHRLALQRGQDLRAFIAQDRSLVFLIFFLTTLFVPLAASQVRPMYVSGRYTIISLFPLVLFVGPLVSRFGNRLLVPFFCCVLVLATAAGFVRIKMRPPQIDDRSAAEYIVARANRGDLLIFTGLSRVSIDYYLRRFHVEGRFAEITFPAEVARHPGYMDMKKMLAGRDNLEREADSVAGGAYDALSGCAGARIWVLYGSDNEINPILKQRLEGRFTLVDEKNLSGSSFDKILVYRGS